MTSISLRITLDILKVLFPGWGGGGGGEDTPIYWLYRVCAAGKGMVFEPFSLVQGLVIIANWSSIGSRLTGLLTKD